MQTDTGMERTNEVWLSELRNDNPHQTEALEDLRQYLQRGVLAYLRSRSDLSNFAETEMQQMS